MYLTCLGLTNIQYNLIQQIYLKETKMDNRQRLRSPLKKFERLKTCWISLGVEA